MSAPKLHPTVRYAEPEYWDSRYEREPALFEWFFGHTALRRIIRAYISKKKLVLQIGCGTSNLQEGMAKSGYAVINTDISPVVINQMKERHAKYPNLSYVISDCLNMPEFRDGQFGHVIDKGTMDALLCCKTGTDNVLAMLSEVYRVLQPGGSFLLVTLGDPTRRLPLLLHPKLHWKVSLLMLPKISGAAQVYVDGKPINDTKEPIDADGPYEVLQDQTIVGLPADVQYGNYFFAYVCKKPTTPLSHSQGERVQLPNGWVAGSKEVFQKLQKEFGLPEDLLQKGRRKKIMHVPAGSKHGLPGVSHSATSSSSSNAGAAAALGVVPAQDADRIMQEDQRHLQELTPSTPSVAGLQGSQRRHSEQLPAMTQDQHQPIQHTQQAQSPVKSASTADAKLDVLLNSAQKQQQQQQDGKLQNGVSRKLEVPARPQSAPNVVEIGLDGLPSFGVARRTFADAPASTSGAPFDAALAVHSPAAAAPSTAATATPKQLTAQAPATAEQTQQQQHDGVEPGAAKEGHAFSFPAAQSPAGSADTVHPYSGIIATGGAQDLAPGWSLDPPGLVAAAPRAPRAQRIGAPKVRRFRTECSSQSLTALQPQLAVLRQQQAQHSERATDGLVMHDVAASEALGSSGASVAAIAGAVWGHTRPPRDRRFSNMSIMSSLSAVSSVTNTEGEDDEESDAVQDYIPLCSGDSDGHVQVGQQEQQQQSDANGATSVLRIGTQTPSRLSTNGYGGQESDLEHQHDVAAGTGPLLEHRSDGAPVQQSSSAELAVESSAEGATGALQQQLAAVTLSAVRSQPAGQADSTSNGVSAAAAKAAALQPAGEAETGDDVQSATQEQT